MPEVPVLDAVEARVLGVLIEKELTTPDQYPLSLNALAAGCNQKSNRDPVLALSEHDVRSALERLRMQQLAGAVQPAGGRVERWRHNAREVLAATEKDCAVLAELLLRGPQQPGELRGRAARMRPIETLEELEALLAPLCERGLAKKLAPEPGSRAPRFAQRLSPDAHPAPVAAAGGGDPEVEILRRRVAELEAELARAKDEIRRILGQR